MATIGRRAAIAQLPRGWVIRGTAGWLAWLALYLVHLIGFRNRVVVLVNWARRYFKWPSGPRLILGNLASGPVTPPPAQDLDGETGEVRRRAWSTPRAVADPGRQ